MEERKRSYDGSGITGEFQMNSSAQQPKRLRPEEIVGIRDDPSKAMCRLLLNRAQFSRIIGKGGQTIGQIRNNTGVQIKGSDIDDENRLIVISGTLDQVLNAFDVTVELLHQSAIAEYTSMLNSGMALAPRSMDHILVTLLLEHSKAGKAVGAKGAMMQTIKVKSNASAIRIDKEPIDVNGVSLRRLTIEGTLASIRRAHLLVQELYAEPVALSTSANYNAYAAQSGIDMHHVPRPPVPFGGPSPFDVPVVAPSPSSLSPNGVTLMPVPLQSLVSYGVQAETVRQLTEMKTYLWRHFGLDLNVSREEALPPTPVAPALNNFGAKPVQMPSMQNISGMRPASVESVIEARKSSHPHELCFSVPKSAVGAVIGKGGQNLKDLQAQFGVRVYIEKEDYGGKRLVVLSNAGSTSEGEVSGDDGMLRCQHHIDSVVQECLMQRQHVDGMGSYGSDLPHVDQM